MAAAQPGHLPYVTFDRGEREIVQGTVLDIAGARRMSELGPDAFRFTFDPGSALGMPAIVFEGRRQQNAARLDVTWFERGRAVPWVRRRYRRFSLSAMEYDDLVRDIDAALAEGERISARVNAGEEFLLCTDGFNLLTERNRAGVVSWMDGDCGEQPNHRIRSLLSEWTLARLGTAHR